MRPQATKNYPTTKQETGFIKDLDDVILRASSEAKAELVERLLEGDDLDPFQKRLLRSAGDLGLRLPQAHQATYDAMKAKSAEHGKAVSVGVKSYRAAKAQAEQASPVHPANGKQIDPTAEMSTAPETSFFDKLADYVDLAPPETGSRGSMAPGSAPTPSSSALPQSGQPPHPLRPVAPKPNN